MGVSRPAAANVTPRARRAVFFDRDGVLNEATVREGKPYPPESPSGIAIVPGAREAVMSLREAGFVTICVTNQPDVARGSLDAASATAMNDFVVTSLALDDLVACFHDDADGCPCRKPRPGMLVESADRWSVALERSYLVGDRWRDIDAGATAGCRTVLIDRGWEERPPANKPDARVASIADAVTWILADARREYGNA